MASASAPQPAARGGGSLLSRIVGVGETVAYGIAAQRTAATAQRAASSAAPYVVAGVGIIAVAVVAVLIFRR